jgi:hypothetical protein
MTSLVEYLKNYTEEMPIWLKKIDSNENSDDHRRATLQNFLNSRLVYYPGSGYDGGPVSVFNRSGSAHCFFYVDYGIEQADLASKLDDPTQRFLGYTQLTRIDLVESDFNRQSWVAHVTPQSAPPIPHVTPYAFIQILVRNADRGDDFGAARIAVLFIAADGFATFDALYCQENSAPPPYCIVLQDHGFGGGYDTFGNGGILHTLAKNFNASPMFLLAEEGPLIWDDYKACDCDAAPMGQWSNLRTLHQKDL